MAAFATELAQPPRPKSLLMVASLLVAVFPTTRGWASTHGGGAFASDLSSGHLWSRPLAESYREGELESSHARVRPNESTLRLQVGEHGVAAAAAAAAADDAEAPLWGSAFYDYDAPAAEESGPPSIEQMLAAISESLAAERETLKEDGAPASKPLQPHKHASYCNPPNPCPKGKTAANDKCQEGVPDTEEFNRMYILRQMELGMCPCDNEHNSERSCPTSPDYEVLPGMKKIDWSRIDAMLHDTASSAPGVLDVRKIAAELRAGKRRVGLKQGFREQPHVDIDGEQSEVNPFLLGNELESRVAKKSPLML